MLALNMLAIFKARKFKNPVNARSDADCLSLTIRQSLQIVWIANLLMADNTTTMHSQESHCWKVMGV
jgi:hypothetical protein